MIKIIKPITAVAMLSFVLGYAGPALGQAKAPTPQGKPAAGAAPTGAPTKEGEQAEPPAAAPEEEDVTEAPVLWITSVELIRSAHEPSLDIVRVRGITGSEGWESGELIPMTKGKPDDGILDLAFVAQAPTDPSDPADGPTIEATFTLEPGHPYKGVRVYGATNRLVLKTLPGYVEAPAAPNSCSTCVGKIFVAKGASAPSGVSADQVVREETLPKTVHVITSDEGLGKLDSDPNRLTLVLGEGGKILIAVWD